jgi:glutamate 5-kinase
MNVVFIKLGTKSVFTPGWLEETAKQVAKLETCGYRVVITTSGAVHAGIQVLGDSYHRYSKQVRAGFGTIALLRMWEDVLAPHNLLPVPLLVTHSNFTTAGEAESLKNQLWNVLQHKDGIVIANENDLVSDEEIRYWGAGLGENDKLQVALVTLVQSIPDIQVQGVLFATHQGGYYAADPNTDPHTPLITELSYTHWEHRSLVEVFLAPYISHTGRLPNNVIAKVCAGIVCAYHRKVPRVAIATPLQLTNLMTESVDFVGTRIIA